MIDIKLKGKRKNAFKRPQIRSQKNASSCY